MLPPHSLDKKEAEKELTVNRIWVGKKELKRASGPSKGWRQYAYYLSGAMNICWIAVETFNAQTIDAAQKNDLC